MAVSWPRAHALARLAQQAKDISRQSMMLWPKPCRQLMQTATVFCHSVSDVNRAFEGGETVAHCVKRHAPFPEELVAMCHIKRVQTALSGMLGLPSPGSPRKLARMLMNRFDLNANDSLDAEEVRHRLESGPVKPVSNQQAVTLHIPTGTTHARRADDDSTGAILCVP